MVSRAADSSRCGVLIPGLTMPQLSTRNAEPFLRLAVFVPTRAAWPEGWVASGALMMAVDEVNRRSELGGLKLHMEWREIGCDSSSASAELSRLLEEGPVDAVIGPWCSLGCESSAYLTGGRNILQVSYSCTSDVLSDKLKFPTVMELPNPSTRSTPHDHL
jgi:hypothetical protein